MQVNPTPYTDINARLDQLLVELQVLLSKKLVGLYLYGSLVTGDFDHECSDIDLLAALSSDINEKEFDALQQSNLCSISADYEPGIAVSCAFTLPTYAHSL